MLEHILEALDRAGWDWQEFGGWYCATYEQQGLLLGYLAALDQDWWSLIKEHKEIRRWNAVVFCPQGLDSSNLRRSFPDRLQFWFWDMQTSEVFPYPPTRDFTVVRWLESIARGGPAIPLPVTEKNNLLQKAWVTYVIIGIDVLVFMLMNVAGGTMNEEVLIRFGAKVNALVQAGQVWRLLTSAFIHIGYLHLAFNMYALWTLGPLAEELFGHWRFLTVYLLSALGGAIASFLFSPALSAGASGAIFGLFGALLAYSWRQRQVWRSGLGLNLLIVICVNLFFGWVQPGIDNYAHAGGLLIGLLSSFVINRIAT